MIDIPNKTTRNKVLEFINDPVKAFHHEFRNDRNVLLERNDGNETLDKFNNEFANEMNKTVKRSTGDKFINDFATNNQKPRGYNTGKDIATILSDNKGGFFERFIRRNTSKEYKALEGAIKAATDPRSSTYGDFSQVKFYAKKYLEHKLPEGTNEANVSTTGKKRIEFCRSVLNALNDLPEKFKEPEIINNDIDKIMPDDQDKVKEIKVEVAKDNDEFQKNLNESLNQQPKNNNNIIEKGNEELENEL